MVNLFEPFIVSLLKQKSKPNLSPNGLPSLVKEPSIKVTKNLSSDPTTVAATEKIPLRYREIKNSFFREQNTCRWIEILKDQESQPGKLNHPWNFLFPEIPWSEERLYWEDKRKGNLFYGTLLPKKDTYLLCVLFESRRTGKIWIYLEYNEPFEKTSIVSIQTEREAIQREIEKDKESLESELKGLGKIRIHVETSNVNLAKMTQIGTGLFA